MQSNYQKNTIWAIALPRRTALKGLLTLMSGTMFSCLPDSRNWKDWETATDPDEDLRAFMETVIPGIPYDEPGLTVVFYDEYYRFAPYRNRFIRDLRRRAARLFGRRQFAGLPLRQRTEIVEDALARPGISRHLYSAAIFLTQIAGYTGFYKEAGDCSLISFQTKYEPTPTSYANYTEYLAKTLTGNGNFK